MKDYSKQVLTGEGDTDYARYMRTDTLLSLQRGPDEVVHRDELLFQVVHQTTELWLKLTCADLDEAAERIGAGELESATGLLGRASLGIELVTGQLEMMRHLSPWDFQLIRTVLGHGSGADSPGWRAIRRCGRRLEAAFAAMVRQTGLDLAELYRSGLHSPEHRLAEALIEWDERISLWRVRHYKMATRVIGHQVVGTQGTPVDVLASLINYKFFPELWELRDELTRTGPMAETAL
ncbi:tryptophan 2,3-dioxygenase family protein [Microbispora amethystogenes]|uniref:Tryptophan 2,3-dioxygenase n=1 Tax=Microbispora amethystogenes TaxID=1427754 RepID=A0ABQ4FP60_9ACTN|nr:tryptophan 2,3-dioxygenase family protein [Microbispora amethystogenes]GIH36604.1 tryptophan 2,3-dioxygenase [Microbispora amethystogenes]